MKFFVISFCFLALGTAHVLREKWNHVHIFTKRELLHTFGVESKEHVPNYEVITIRSKQRYRRSLIDSESPLSFGVKIFGKHLNLNLSINSDLIGKTHTIEFHRPNGKVEKYLGVPGEFTHGKVHGDDHSHVAFHHTSKGITGTVRTKRGLYFISPIPRRINPKGGDHVVYSSNDLPKGHFGCATKDDTVKRSNIITSADHNRVRRSTQPIQTMELLVAADYAMVNKYTKDFLPTYLMAYSNIMAGFFKDPSLIVPLNVVVLRTVIFETDEFNATGIVSLLNHFSEWTKRNNPSSDDDPQHVDSALLVTRNGCHGGCGVEGIANSNTYCGSSAQGVARDHGLMSSITGAHELAHILNVGHDQSDECPDSVNIMATGSAFGTKTTMWSACSARRMKASLAKASCFDDEPATHLTNSSFQLYGQVFTADKQCQFTFDSEISRNCAANIRKKRCHNLYCNFGGSTCHALIFPAAHGTHCSPHMWCIHGTCVPDGTVPNTPIDGQWSKWGEYTPCNRPCGLGVQWKTRTCTNPAPAHGGEKCDGDTIGEFKTCNAQPCVGDIAAFRLQQCRDLNLEYKAIFNMAEPCQLLCGTWSLSTYYGTVADGTKCDPTSNRKDVCIQGACRNVGCDLELSSGNELDRCQVCMGNGTSCQLYIGSNYGKYASRGHYPLTTIPAQAHNIAIKEVGNTFNFLGFKVGTSSSYTISLPTYGRTYDLEGTNVIYKMYGYHYADQLLIENNLPIDIHIFLVNFYLEESEGITWHYYSPVTNATKIIPNIAWKPSQWSKCDKSCAGGFQSRTLSCIRGDDNSTISQAACSHLKVPTVTQRCNTQDCPPFWDMTPWPSCSKSCGNGTHTRKLYCSVNTVAKKVEVTDSECTSKPSMETFRYCNVKSCPAIWVMSRWSECSKSCGSGHMTRNITCRRTNADGSIIDVHPLECTYLPTPEVTGKCNDDVLCPTWHVSYSECSKTCGDGEQTATVLCRIPPSVEKIDDSKCDVSTKPTPANKACNKGACGIIYDWVIVEGTCSVTCGSGLIPLSIVCQRKADNKVAGNANCKLEKPSIPDTKECNAGICPERFGWKVKFSDCSKTCGGGIKSSIPYCVRLSNASTVNNILCDVTTKPASTTQICSIEACPLTYTWIVKYRTCSVTCGNGTKKAIAVCNRDNDKADVDNTLCDVSKKLGLVDKACYLGTCPPTYSWLVEYSSCSVTCGTGVQQPYIMCVRNLDKTEMVDKMCDQSKRPDKNLKPCKLDACLADFYWVAKHGHCTAICGPGYKLKFMKCIERKTRSIAEHFKCNGMDIPKDEPCELTPCAPAFNTTKMPLTYPIGCFADIPHPRRIPNYLKYYAKTEANLIELCAKKANSLKYEFFGLQYDGECWAGDAATAETYFLSGYAHNCVDGVGRSASNFVYKIGSPHVTKSLPPVVKLGCYQDDLTYPRTVPEYISNFKKLFRSNPNTAGQIIEQCAEFTQKRGWNIFGMQYGGECWSGENALKTYNRAGESLACKHGLGGINSYTVYTFYDEEK